MVAEREKLHSFQVQNVNMYRSVITILVQESFCNIIYIKARDFREWLPKESPGNLREVWVALVCLLSLLLYWFLSGCCTRHSRSFYRNEKRKDECSHSPLIPWTSWGQDISSTTCGTGCLGVATQTVCPNPNAATSAISVGLQCSCCLTQTFWPQLASAGREVTSWHKLDMSSNVIHLMGRAKWS